MKNNVQLIGFVGTDPKVITFKGDKQLVKISLATTENFKSPGGEWKSNTQWHNLVAWGKTAGYIQENIKKGNEVAISGKLQYNSFENKEGIKQTITEVVINELVKITKDKELPF